MNHSYSSLILCPREFSRQLVAFTDIILVVFRFSETKKYTITRETQQRLDARVANLVLPSRDVSFTSRACGGAFIER